jgi:DNA processing protein
VADPGEVLRPGAARDRSALRAWLAVQAAFVFEPQRARRLLDAGAQPERALAGARQPLPSSAWLDAATARLGALGAVAVPFGSPAYPPRLAALPDAPPVLLVRGDPAALLEPGIAVVGSRAATAYGRECARRFAQAFARAGLAVTSGLALGIDGAAHTAALDAGGRTLAVLACGPETVYPTRHRGLADGIRSRGALVTEFPPGTPPRAAHFPLRNRVISALSAAVLVVEARERSGSLVTARHAADQSVEVWAVPGPIDAPTSAGTNRLIADGCGVALSPEWVLEALAQRGVIPSAPAHRSPPGKAAERPRSEASPQGLPSEVHGDDGRILAALRESPCTRDELCRRLACEPRALARELLDLELAGCIAEDRDGRLRARSRDLA